MLFHRIRRWSSTRPHVQQYSKRSVRLILEGLEERNLLSPTIWTVTSTADSGPNTLRADVAAANPGDIIVFSQRLSGQTIYLNSEINVNKSLEIGGSTHTGVAASGQNNYRIFEFSSGTSDLDGMTIEDGSATDGGAVLVDPGVTLSVSWDTFENNTAAYGGAIYN